MKVFSTVAAATAALLITGCAEHTTTAAPAPTPAARSATHTAQASTNRYTAEGHFTGASDHVTTGTTRVYRDAEGWKIELGDDFRFDGGAPDAKVALGNNGYIRGTTLGELRSNSGQQVYALPAGLDIGDYTQVWIWCEQFSVPLGHADLTLL